MAGDEPQSGHEVEPGPRRDPSAPEVHPVWQAFMRFCRELRHGEIDQLKIQDGLPLLAEVTKKKVKFT
ncbi:MAG: hypothetical protein ACREB3_00820 [Burkholderiales bacterium]